MSISFDAFLLLSTKAEPTCCCMMCLSCVMFAAFVVCAVRGVLWCGVWYALTCTSPKFSRTIARPDQQPADTHTHTYIHIHTHTYNYTHTVSLRIKVPQSCVRLSQDLSQSGAQSPRGSRDLSATVARSLRETLGWGFIEECIAANVNARSGFDGHE